MLMIDRIRKHASAWYTKVFLAVLAICFVVLWGGGDMLQQGFIGNGQTVLTIGGEKINTRQFARDLQIAMAQFESQTGQRITPAEAKKIGLFNNVLRGMVQKTLIDMEADRLGLVVTDETLREVIQGNPMFGDGGGGFDRDRFNEFLRHINLSEASYLSELRRDLRRIQLIQSITNGVSAPKVIVDKLYKWQNEKRVVKVIPITAKSIQKLPTPTEADLKELWEKNPSQMFTAPEYRTLSALVFGLKNVKVEVPAASVREVYESRKDTDFKGKSLMQASKEIEAELKGPLQEKALEDLRAEIEDMEASGATLQEIAQKYKLEHISLKDVDITGGHKDLKVKPSKHKLADLVIRTGFATDVDETSETVETSTGDYMMVHTDGVIPSEKAPYEEIKAEVKKSWIEVHKLMKAEDDAKALATQINKDGARAARAYKTKTITVERQPTEAVQKLGIAPNLIGRIFALDAQRKALSMPSTAEPGSLVIIHEKVIPASTKTAKDMKEFERRIASMLKNDVVQQYLVTLEQRYKVELNKKALEAF